MDIAPIRNLVAEECRKSTNVYGTAFFGEHIEVVAHYAARLATRLQANAEAVELAAYLHDIAAVRDATTLPRHAELGAEDARRMLPDFGYPAAIVDSAAAAIATHPTPVAMDAGTLEQVCVSHADAIAQIVRPVYWCHLVFGIRKLAFEEGRQWLRDRVESNWNALIPAARKLCAEEYLFASKLYEM